MDEDRETGNKPKRLSRKYNPVTIALTEDQSGRLDVASSALGLTRSEASRRAIEYWLNHYEADKLDEKQTKVLRELKSLRALIIKAIMTEGQNIYFNTLPLIKAGYPDTPTPQADMDEHWKKSLKFAAASLREPLGIPPEAKVKPEKAE